jgi:acylphosphatase
MEMDLKKAHNFVHNTGSRLMSHSQNITDAVRKIFPYYYELEEVMGSRASMGCIDLFDGEDDNEANTVNNKGVLQDDIMSVLSCLSSRDADSAVERSTIKTGKQSKSAASMKKRPISLQRLESPSKVAKNPTLILASNLSTTVEKAVAQKLQYHGAIKMQNDAKLTIQIEGEEKELEQQQHWRENELKWKDAEMKCLQDKTEVEICKGRVEIQMMEIK